VRDLAVKMAYEAHRRYLDADSADSGPIEDYIAGAINAAVLRCALICRERAELFGMGSEPWNEAMNCYDAIRNEFGLEPPR
jgi:hypothetical protein